MAKRNRDALIAFILLYTNLFAASPVIFTEHNRNLQTLESVPMLFNYHRQTISEERAFFTYPRRDTSFIRNFKQTEENALFSSSQELNGHFYAFAASIVGGVDYRGSETLGDTIWPSVDGGLYFRGFADSLDFDLDARIYAEKHSAEKAQSYDGEVFDTQTEDGNAGADYVSYARYRAHMGLNYSWMRLQLARDVMHWGPGYYNNLALNQFALPYNMLSLEFYFGPLHIETFYADLRVASWSYSLKNLNDRNLYGHRYELALKNLTIGVTELQVLYNENKPWLFTPFVPLFIEKGNYSERVNNGALSLDINYRLFNTVRLYGEFFLDDMESPIALYENKYSNNRWAGMLGLQAGHDFYIRTHKLEAGTLAEIARVEPYTYCHYDTAAAQLAHLGLPIGNPNGPNSLAIDWTIYSLLDNRIYAAIHNKWLWKGTDAGSAIDDPYKTIRKRFIHGAPLVYTITPALKYSGNYTFFSAEVTFGDTKAVALRYGFKW